MIMEITDNQGKRITVTDLNAAIKQAKAFMEYRHENPGFTHLDHTLKAYWADVYEKLCSLQELQKRGGDSPEVLQTYRLKSNTGAPDLLVTLDDLEPITNSRTYSYRELMGLTADTHYQTDWNTPMGKEHGMLAARYRTSFFKIKGASLVVIPGTYLYPTDLSADGIREME